MSWQTTTHPVGYDLAGNLKLGTDNCFLLMDGARFKSIFGFIYGIEDNPVYEPLYRGTFYESALEVSPCLVDIERRFYKGFLPWFIETGADENKAILIQSPETLSILAKHFKDNIEAKLPSSEIVMFRFYDPEIFNDLAPLAANANLNKLLKPCSAIYWKQNGSLYELSNEQTL